jgi:carbon storage regulator
MWAEVVFSMYDSEVFMLVLARKKGEVIIIGNDIEIVVVEIRGGKVRLGVVAPEDIRIDRKEVRDRIATEGERKRTKTKRR